MSAASAPPGANAQPAAAFERQGPDVPASPIVLAVPHAGRLYPQPLLDGLKAPAHLLQLLEDRYVDALAMAALGRETLITATHPRAYIDLNRAEHERDHVIDMGAPVVPEHSRSLKLRSGLGLIPAKAGGIELWRRRFSDAEVQERIMRVHRPYHAAISDALAAARARFGVAVLLDIHSMPPLPLGAARLVIGDRFGQASAPRFVARIEQVALQAQLRVACNTPYAGGYVLERHANPTNHIHAIQLEFDRTLYLDRRRDLPGDGMAAMAQLLRNIIDAVADEALPMVAAAQ